MPICNECGRELIYSPEDPDHEWACPNDCAFEKAAKQIQEMEDAKTFEEIEAEIQAIDDHHEDANTSPPERTHCWLCKDRVVRTEETRDGPYGNYCVNGHSLRKHPFYGEGAPGDRALTYRRYSEAC